MKSRMFVKTYTCAGNGSFEIQPGARRRWRIHRARFELVTDATVANRHIVITPLDTPSLSHVCGEVITGSVRAASGTIRLNINTVQALVGATDTDTDVVRQHEPIVLDIGQTLEVTVTAGVAGDSLTAYVVVEEEQSAT